EKLDDRKAANSLRSLSTASGLIDFSSNDYLGFAHNETIFAGAFQLLLKKGISQNGASGSRLISGNHRLYQALEEQLCKVHQAESALVFNSGYDANIGFFSAVPQRTDVVFYDEFIHASIRDGIIMGTAKAYKFSHNDLEDLKLGIERSRNASDSKNEGEVYIVTESVFSMDGDRPDLKSMNDFCKQYGFHLVVDEAHAIGVFGKQGAGMVHELGIENDVFARIITFGKALGSHGAAVLGSQALVDYLVNFARSFIYTTGLPPHTLVTVLSAYQYLASPEGSAQVDVLRQYIYFFTEKLSSLKLAAHFISSDSAIQSCIVPGNTKVKSLSKKLADDGFDVRAILSPTVPEGKERLRFCLHSTNGEQEIGLVLQLLKKYL
ncbi:MAG: 8-amino-7-oxononanoate synthase, partial [Flavobacteriaceae bacterium]